MSQIDLASHTNLLTLNVPPLLSSSQPFLAKMGFTGDKSSQTLRKLDVTFECDQPARTFAFPTQPMFDAALEPNQERYFELKLQALHLQDLFESMHDYAELLLGTDEARVWPGEAPLSWTGFPLGGSCRLVVSAELARRRSRMGSVQVHHLPPAAGPLKGVPGLRTHELNSRLENANAERVWVSNARDHWFIFWQNAAGQTVGHSPLKIVCAARSDGLHRAFSNPNIPPACALGRLHSESKDGRRPGAMDDARLWAEDLIAEARAGILLPRPLGNAWAVLTDLKLLAQ